jgi:hypothetical protein
MPKTLVFAYPLFKNATIPRTVFVRPAKERLAFTYGNRSCQEADVGKENQNALIIFALDFVSQIPAAQ